MPSPSVPRRRAIGDDYECLGRGIVVNFSAKDRSFQALVALGRRVPRARLAEAERLLDSLVVQKIPPPAPPGRWPSIDTEAGASRFRPRRTTPCARAPSSTTATASRSES